MDDTTNKILLIRKFESDNRITPCDINISCSPNVQINMSNDEFSYIQQVFKSMKSKPTDINELKKLYIILLKHIFGNFDIVKSVKNKASNNKTITNYILNDTLIKQLFNLIFIKYYKHLDDNLLKLIGIENPNLIDDVEDEQLKLYKFKGRN